MVDSMITLFETTSTEYTNNGIGSLPDAVTCIVVEERNGEYELEMVYPINGQRYSDLSLRRIIMAKPNPYSDPQPFRIYAITKPINGLVTVNAEHISYDLSGYPVSPFEAASASEAFVKMKNASVLSCPFTFSTDKETTADMTVLTPSSMRYLLGGVEGSILDTYKGEYEFDKFSVKLHNNRGANNGVSIRYGKNLTDLNQEENCSSVYTGVYPYWYSEQDGLLELPDKIVNAEGTYDFVRVCPLDLSYKWQEKPTEEDLRSEAISYMKTNNIGIPKISITVSFVSLTQSEEYKDFAILERVRLCDTVNVEFMELKVSATAKCISTTYNVIVGKYDKIELGDAVSNLASTVSSQNQAINNNPDKTFMEQAIENATKLITGGLGGHVLLHSSSNGTNPDEILIMDTDSITTATKTWRWNKNGLGYSDKGYNGPYGLAMTMDGSIVANYVNTGTLSGILVKSGNYVANTTGTLINLLDGTIDTKNFKIATNGTVTFLSPSIPTKTSQFLNDSGFQDATGVTSIIGGTVTTDYVNTLGVTAKRIVVGTIFDARVGDGHYYDDYVTIGGWSVIPGAIYNGIAYTGAKNNNSTGMGHYGSDWAFWAGNGRFSVKQSGDVVTNRITMTGRETTTVDGAVCQVNSYDGAGYTNMFGKGMHIKSNLSAAYIALNTNSGGALTCFGDNVAQQVSIVTSSSGVPYVNVTGSNGANAQLTPTGVQTGSLEKYKTNFVKENDLLSDILETDVYSYNYKDQLSHNKTKKAFGFVIGEKYKLTDKVTNEEGNSIDLYTSIAVAWVGIKQLHQIIQAQQEEIDQLKLMIA